MWDAESELHEGQLPLEEVAASFSSMDLSPDEGLMAKGGWDGSLYLVVMNDKSARVPELLLQRKLPQPVC